MDDQGNGWLLFAAIMLIFAGVMRLFDAFWAFGYDGTAIGEISETVFGRDMDTYGWIFLVAAIVLIASGFLVLARSQLARWVGVFAAFVAMISAVGWLPVQPVWSMLYILIAVLVIYALVAHGGRDRTYA